MFTGATQITKIAMATASPGRRAGQRRGGGGGCCGILFGVLGVVLLFWNEGRSARAYGTIQEGLKQVVSLKSIEQVDPKNAGKLVHLTGTLDTPDTSPLEDPTFGVTTKAPALCLLRQSQMYQWREVSERTSSEGGGDSSPKVVYSYQRVWSSRVIPSNGFHNPEGHVNPTSMKFSSQLFTSNVRIGAFRVPTDMTNTLPSYSVGLSMISVSDIPPNSDAAEAKQKGDDAFYFGQDPYYPEVGDTMINYLYHPTGVTYSILAEQTADGSFAPYKTKSGGVWFEFVRGTVTAEEMFASAAAANQFLTKVLRIVGFFLLYIGCNSLLSPLLVVGGLIPCVGDCLAGTVLPFISAVVSLLVYGLVVGFAWLFYRPMLSVALLVGIGVVGLGLYRQYQKKQEGFAVAQTEADADGDLSLAETQGSFYSDA